MAIQQSETAHAGRKAGILIVLCLLFVAGCSKQEKETGVLSVNKQRIVFDNPAAGETAQAVLHIEASRDWTVQYQFGNGHECHLSARSGTAGACDLIVETPEINTGRELRNIGQLAVFLNDGSASETVSLMQRPATVRQTLLMYFCGTELYHYYKTNLNDVAKALGKNFMPLGRIVAFTQPEAQKGYVVEYRYDEETNACRRDTLIRYAPLPGHTTDPETMAAILSEMADLAPAERYGLHLASHAKGWLPASVEGTSLLRRLSATGAGDLWRKAPGAVETRWFGHDRGRYMNITELADAIDATGIHFDYLLFDACFMSSVEALYDLRNSAAYIVASPCEVMGHGFPYDTAIPTLFTEEGAGYDLTALCKSYYDYYANTDSYNSGCIAMTVCSELDALADAMHALNAGATKSVDVSALQSYDGMKEHQFYDLENYALELTDDPALAEQFVSRMERCFPVAARFHTAQFYSVYNNRMNDIGYYSGVTTYAPATTYQADWQQTAWHAATKQGAAAAPAK